MRINPDEHVIMASIVQFNQLYKNKSSIEFLL